MILIIMDKSVKNFVILVFVDLSRLIVLSQFEIMLGGKVEAEM